VYGVRRMCKSAIFAVLFAVLVLASAWSAEAQSDIVTNNGLVIGISYEEVVYRNEFETPEDLQQFSVYGNATVEDGYLKLTCYLTGGRCIATLRGDIPRLYTDNSSRAIVVKVKAKLINASEGIGAYVGVTINEPTYIYTIMSGVDFVSGLSQVATYVDISLNDSEVFYYDVAHVEIVNQTEVDLSFLAGASRNLAFASSEYIAVGSLVPVDGGGPIEVSSLGLTFEATGGVATLAIDSIEIGYGTVLYAYIEPHVKTVTSTESVVVPVERWSTATVTAAVAEGVDYRAVAVVAAVALLLVAAIFVLIRRGS